MINESLFALRGYAQSRPLTEPQAGGVAQPRSAAAQAVGDFAQLLSRNEETAMQALTGGADPHALVEAPRAAGPAEPFTPDNVLTFGKLDANYKSWNATRDTIPSHLIVGPEISAELSLWVDDIERHLEIEIILHEIGAAIAAFAQALSPLEKGIAMRGKISVISAVNE